MKILHPIHHHLIGKKVNATINGKEYKNRTVHFVGINAVGHRVISFEEGRIIHYLKEWKELKITEA